MIHFQVGPYWTQRNCQDTFGSAIFNHPIACHLTGKAADCINLGNGFAYPKGYIYPPVPSLTPADDQGCKHLPVEGVNWHAQGLYFIYYKAGGSGIAACSQYKTMSKDPDVLVGLYKNITCPGAPCFTISADTACN